MTAPKRTVTMPALLVCTVFLQLFFSSCADKIKTDIIAFRALDEGLANSNRTIEKSSQTLYAYLEQKTTEPATAEKARVWYPKAQLIQKLSKDIYSYIEGLRAELKKEADLQTNDGIESFKESDKNAVMRLFDKKGKGDELYQRLKNYKKDVLATDPQIAKEFGETFILTTKSFDSSEDKHPDLWRTFFDDNPTVAALAILSKFQNNIRINENRMTMFCYDKCSGEVVKYDTYSAIITQNSSYVKANEEIEITSGIGAFSKAAQPVITINGKTVSIDEGGAAHYKFKTSDKPGKHIVPVEISFTDQEGKKQTITKSVEYTVAN